MKHGLFEKKFYLKSFLITGLLILSACSSSMESEEGDAGSDESVTTAETSEKSPTDAVPGDEQGSPEALATATGENPDDAPPPAPDLGTSSEAPPAVAEASPAPAAVSEPSVVAQNNPPPAEAAPPAPVAVAEPAPVAVAEPAPAVVAEAAASAPIAQVETPVAPAVEAPVSGEGVAYTVKAGDTLMKISWEQYGDLYRWREIYTMNKGKISDPNHVPPGTQIQLSGSGRSPASAIEHKGDQYLIVMGDTLGKISNKVYGSMQKWKAIWENNKQLIRDPNKIYAGFYLFYVPEAKMSSTETKDAEEVASES